MKNIDNYSQSCDSSNVIINEYGNDNDDSIKKMKTPNSNFKMLIGEGYKVVEDKIKE